MYTTGGTLPRLAIALPCLACRQLALQTSMISSLILQSNSATNASPRCEMPGRLQVRRDSPATTR